MSIQELEAILNAMRSKEDRQRMFDASLQGIDLGKSKGEDVEQRLQAVKRRAQARLEGVNEEDVAFRELGIGTIPDE